MTGATQGNPPRRKVAIITGANAGVGYAIAQRMVQESPYPLTIVLACRNRNRGEEAQRSLTQYFSTYPIEKLGGILPEFKLELVDVGDVASVRKFSKSIQQQYRRVDFLFCNAGILPSTGIKWGKLAKDLVTKPMDLVRRSDVLNQPPQSETKDGLANVFACNVFGHYIMIRELESLLSNTADEPGKIIWTSSMTSEKSSFSIHDIQGWKAAAPYESSKWATDLLAIRLNEIWATSSLTAALAAPAGAAAVSSSVETTTTSNKRLTRSVSAAKFAASQQMPAQNSQRHIISVTTHPGVVSSGIGGIPLWLSYCRLLVHYLVRLMGDPTQTIKSRHGAVANTYVALWDSEQRGGKDVDWTWRYGSCVTRTGKEYVDSAKVVEYDSKDGELLVEQMEQLLADVTLKN